MSNNTCETSVRVMFICHKFCVHRNGTKVTSVQQMYLFTFSEHMKPFCTVVLLEKLDSCVLLVSSNAAKLITVSY
jgi:hypothetical protein